MQITHNANRESRISHLKGRWIGAAYICVAGYIIKLYIIAVEGSPDSFVVVTKMERLHEKKSKQIFKDMQSGIRNYKGTVFSVAEFWADGLMLIESVSSAQIVRVITSFADEAVWL